MENNKKMEEIFEDIMTQEDFEDNTDNQKDDSKGMTTKKTSDEVKKELMDKLSTIEKIEIALERVSDLDQLDGELDSIATEAIQSYSELFNKAGTFADAHAGKIYEVSAQLLKIALDAKDRKLDRKLKTLDLQLKMAKLESDEKKGDETPEQIGISREDVLDAIRSTNSTELKEEDFNLDRKNAKGGTE